MEPFGDLLSATWEAFMKNVGPLLGVFFAFFGATLLVAGVLVGFGFLVGFSAGFVKDLEMSIALSLLVVAVLLGLLLFVGIVVFGAWSQSALIVVARRSFERHDTSFRESLREGWEHMLRILWASILTGLVTFVGFLLLIVPGLYFIVKLTFVPYIIVAERRSVSEAFSKSWRMSEGYFWAIFVRLLFVWAVSFFASYVPVFGLFLSIFIGLLSTMYLYGMYRDLDRLYGRRIQ